MRAINTQWTAKNEHTMPLVGEPIYTNSGIIKAVDKDIAFSVAQIDFERYDEENYQYIFSPIWSTIDALPTSIFTGIPGLDMDMRLAKYYRVNMTPSFIEGRTPGTGREDLWELMEDVGLDYYDRFEWLLRTPYPCGIDNLIVDRLPQSGNEIHVDSETEEEVLKNINCRDRVTVPGIVGQWGSVDKFQKSFIYVLQSGAEVFIEEENRAFSEEERYAMLKLLVAEQKLKQEDSKAKQAEGIARAKSKGKYKGRKPIALDENLLETVCHDFDDGKIDAKTAMSRLELESRATFYRRMRVYREKLQSR